MTLVSSQTQSQTSNNLKLQPRIGAPLVVIAKGEILLGDFRAPRALNAVDDEAISLITCTQGDWQRSKIK